MKFGHRLPDHEWQVFSEARSAFELSLQAVIVSGLSGKWFISTRDLVIEFTGNDSARFGQAPAFIPPLPSEIRVPTIKFPASFFAHKVMIAALACHVH